MMTPRTKAKKGLLASAVKLVDPRATVHQVVMPELYKLRFRNIAFVKLPDIPRKSDLRSISSADNRKEAGDLGVDLHATAPYKARTSSLCKQDIPPEVLLDHHVLEQEPNNERWDNTSEASCQEASDDAAQVSESALSPH